MKQSDIPQTEELDFHYLLELMRPLHRVPEFEWLPELFSTIGTESFLKLCKYAGGESIRIPTLEELYASIESLRWFYDVYVTKSKSKSGIPERCMPLVRSIQEVYDARNN